MDASVSLCDSGMILMKNGDCKNKTETFENDNSTKTATGVEETEEASNGNVAEDVLIVGCDSDDDIDGFLNTLGPEDNDCHNNNNRKVDHDSPQGFKVSKSKNRKRCKDSNSRSRKKKKLKTAIRGKVDIELSDDNVDSNVMRMKRRKSDEIKRKMSQDFMLNIEDQDVTSSEEADEQGKAFIGVKQAEGVADKNNKENDYLEFDSLRLGNYCSRMLQGVPCTKDFCSWIHYMKPEDAVSQLYRIYSNRPLPDCLRFYRYFTNMEIQEQLVAEAQERLGQEPLGVEARSVAREVLRALVSLSQAMDLGLAQCMEMVDISTGVCDITHGTDTLVTIFNLTLNLVTNTGGGEAKQAAKRLAKWAWQQLYLASVRGGVVLEPGFYSDLAQLLASHQMVAQLAELLLYTALLPGLSPPLPSLAELLRSRD